MSADNWARCPYCVAAARGAHEAKRAAVAAAYGNVPVEEWQAMNDSVPADFDARSVDPTLREDWEVGIYDEDGSSTTAILRYKARCSECGAGVEVSDDVMIGPGR